MCYNTHIWKFFFDAQYLESGPWFKPAFLLPTSLAGEVKFGKSRVMGGGGCLLISHM